MNFIGPFSGCPLFESTRRRNKRRRWVHGVEHGIFVYQIKYLHVHAYFNDSNKKCGKKNFRKQIAELYIIIRKDKVW